jgi:hypothetical protein
MKTENWKAIPGYEGRYEMTLEGKVRSLNYFGLAGRIQELKPGSHPQGYFYVVLSKDAKPRTFGIHRLIAMTFLENIPEGRNWIVDHKNNDQTDNRLENLQIITQRKNVSKQKKRDLPTGVSYNESTKDPSKNRYYAKIRINEKVIWLGTFNTCEEASQAYQQKADELSRS